MIHNVNGAVLLHGPRSGALIPFYKGYSPRSRRCVAAGLGTIARSTPSFMADAFFIHIAQITGSLQVASFAGVCLHLAVLHSAPRGSAQMAGIALGSDIQRDVVGWHASYAGIRAIVACQAITRPERSIVMQVSCTGKACVAPYVAGFAIGYPDSGRTAVDHVDSLRHPPCSCICRIGMAFAARNKRFVVYVIVAEKAVVVRMTGFAVTDGQ